MPCKNDIPHAVHAAKVLSSAESVHISAEFRTGFLRAPAPPALSGPLNGLRKGSAEVDEADT